jgi:hypothetical protein
MDATQMAIDHRTRNEQAQLTTGHSLHHPAASDEPSASLAHPPLTSTSSLDQLTNGQQLVSHWSATGEALIRNW